MVDVQNAPSAHGVVDMDEPVRDTQTARKYFDSGLKAEQANDRQAAIKAYEAAYAADPEDVSVCFRLAYNLDLLGEEQEALHLYEECAHREHPPINALINMAILYEDNGKYAQAERCLRQVLAADPNHPRARLFLKDALASKAMVIDDEQEKRMEKHNAMLDTPVSDFDLTVRTRNALRKMDIRTLGDLLKVTEAELRSYKNFGDASLEEIKSMLAQRGLRMGQATEQQLHQANQQAYEHLKEQAGNDDSLLNKSINELGLSVRARKALALLNITSLAELAMKTEEELMGVKNFGMTSLLEIKEKLLQIGIHLRKLEENQ